MKASIPIILLLLLCTPTLAQKANDTLTAREQIKLEARKSPMGALFRSVVFPGWGQFYNGAYIKGSIVMLTESYFIYKAAHWWRQAEDQYNLVQSLPVDERYAEFQVYESYRGKRNDFLWLVALSVFISMFDAYVDAHLSGFDVDLTPDFDDDQAQAMIKFSYSF
jgi:hypothetical protein